MKSIRRTLVTFSMAVVACGLASAGTITQTFNIPSQPTTWNVNELANTYNSYQASCLLTCGNLTDVSFSVSYAYSGSATGTDQNTGSTGTDSYTFSMTDVTSLSGDGGLINTSSGLQTCSGTPQTGKSFGSSIGGSCSGGPGNFSADELALASFFNTGSTASFTATDFSSQGFVGPNNTETVLGASSATVSLIYTYAAPSSVPEPTTLFLMGSALVGCGLLRKRIKS